MLMEIHAVRWMVTYTQGYKLASDFPVHSSSTLQDRGANPGNFEDFRVFYERMENAGLRTFSAELNYPAIHWNPIPSCS